MSYFPRPPDVESGNARPGDQAESSSANPSAGSWQMRMLIELQVISYLLHTETRPSEDLGRLRSSIARSMT